MILSLADYIALGGLVMALVGPIWGYLHRIRRNDLQHLDAKLEAIMDGQARLEGRMLEHLHDHATGALK